MARRTKKMTLRYWNSLSEGSKKRALTYCFPIHPSTVEMLLSEKPDPNDRAWWAYVWKKVRIPVDMGSYKTCVNNTYLM